MIKFYDEADGRSKAENVQLVATMLRALPAQIETIKSFEVGINQLDSPRAYDLSILADYDNWEDLDLYTKHPAHVAVVEFLNKVREVTHSCDYEV
jgi:hypothetical protein